VGIFQIRAEGDHVGSIGFQRILKFNAQPPPFPFVLDAAFARIRRDENGLRQRFVIHALAELKLDELIQWHECRIVFGSHLHNLRRGRIRRTAGGRTLAGTAAEQKERTNQK